MFLSLRRLSMPKLASYLVSSAEPLSPECAAAQLKPLPDLPVELVLEILKCAASLSRDSAITISLVSSWARQIALPYLFSTVVSHAGAMSPAQVQKAAKHGQAPVSLAPHLGPFVRNLWAERGGAAHIGNEVDLFRSCANVEHLAITSQSLQALAMSCQLHLSEKDTGTAAFPDRLYSITMLSPTYRYEWHFLVGARAPGGGLLLHNITHLRLLEMGAATYAPHAHLPNLTHLALPHLGDHALTHDPVRLPDGVLRHARVRMVVLTMDERDYQATPWYEIRRLSIGARSASRKGAAGSCGFRELVRRARAVDERVYVVLSPHVGQNACTDWEGAARGGETIWEAAVRAREDETYGTNLPKLAQYSRNR